MYVSEKMKTSDDSTRFHPSEKKYSAEEGMDLDSNSQTTVVAAAS